MGFSFNFNFSYNINYFSIFILLCTNLKCVPILNGNVDYMLSVDLKVGIGSYSYFKLTFSHYRIIDEY